MESMHLAKAIERIDSLWILQRDLGTIAAVYVAAYSSSIRNDVIGNLVKLCFVVESEILVLSWSTQNIYKIERWIVERKFNFKFNFTIERNYW